MCASLAACVLIDGLLLRRLYSQCNFSRTCNAASSAPTAYQHYENAGFLTHHCRATYLTVFTRCCVLQEEHIQLSILVIYRTCCCRDWTEVCKGMWSISRHVACTWRNINMWTSSYVTDCLCLSVCLLAKLVSLWTTCNMQVSSWPRNLANRGICYEQVCASICPSICQSHSCVTPKQFKILKYALHHTIQECF